MINNFFIFFFVCLFFNSYTSANEFKFESGKIDILDNGNLIVAIDAKAVSIDESIEIKAQKFNYKKNLDLLEAINGSALIKSDNIKIDFTEMEVDQKNLIISTKKKTIIYDLNNNLSLETEEINFNRNEKVLLSEKKSILKDASGNIFETDYFHFDISKDILKIKNSVLKDTKDNIVNIKLGYINTKSNKLFGKDIEINLNNETFNKKNEPRLKGNSIVYDNDIVELTKGVFTTCKKRDKCPPWQLSANKITHNKKKQIVHYDSALLKVYDLPIFYFPKFFHPDPTVKRKSGFLIPALNNSMNSTNYVNLPYFHVISESKDLTFSPRFYSTDKFLLQTEYRQVTADSSSISDFGIFNEKNQDSKNHFFYNLDKTLEFDYFDETNFKLKIEKTSNDTYLRAQAIDSKIINSYGILENSVNLNMYSDDLFVDANFEIFENLDKNKSDRYEYILPRIQVTKNIDNKTMLDGNFSFKTNNVIKNYQTNIFEKININDLIFDSTPKVSKKGFYNNYEFILKNANTDSQHSGNYKQDENYYFGGLFQYNSSLPLTKENENFQNILKPKMAIKVSPKHTKDKSSSFTRLDVNNIYEVNRLASSDSLEGGASITIGNEFTRINKKTSLENLSLKLANNIRFEENLDLPKTNQVGLKTSNLFGEISFNPNQFFKTKYNFSKKNNFDDATYESITAEFNINKFKTSFDYINENDTQQDKTSYLLSELNFNINDSNDVYFSTRENKEKKLTEYYNLVYQYKNDCLAASVEYSKNYYDDRDIKPAENIFLKLTIMPFGQIASTPDLKK
tara:strand:- start:2871 stop:5258 length:2388 start_codon:yes stop_codon:yes gene_type:complete